MEQAIGDDPRFRILYRLPRLEVEAAIMESNAVFLYSYQEQQPLSILEAMSCGVPWFAPDAGALSTLEGGNRPEKHFPLRAGKSRGIVDGRKNTQTTGE